VNLSSGSVAPDCDTSPDLGRAPRRRVRCGPNSFHGGEHFLRRNRRRTGPGAARRVRLRIPAVRLPAVIVRPATSPSSWAATSPPVGDPGRRPRRHRRGHPAAQRPTGSGSASKLRPPRPERCTPELGLPLRSQRPRAPAVFHGRLEPIDQVRNSVTSARRPACSRWPKAKPYPRDRSAPARRWSMRHQRTPCQPAPSHRTTAADEHPDAHPAAGSRRPRSRPRRPRQPSEITLLPPELVPLSPEQEREAVTMVAVFIGRILEPGALDPDGPAHRP
jgi:hypothetical protein